MNSEYPEIVELNKLWVEHKVIVKVDRSDDLSGKGYYPLTHFNLGNERFSIYVDDEFNDFRYNYPLLNFCLVLRELDGYKFTSDFEVWCQERFLDPKDEKVKEGFENLKDVTERVEEILGNIDSIISDWDFEMNAGAAQALRRSK